MNKTAIIYSFNTKKTSKIATLIQEGFSNDTIEMVNAEVLTEELFLSFDHVIMGVATWFDGELPNFWDEFLPALEELDLKGKKIALFDTLIKNHGTDELLGVLAHEVGHFKKKHIIQRMIFSFIQTAVVFFLLGLVTDQSSAFARQLFDAFGVDHISIYAGLVFFMLLFSPVSRVLSVIGNLSSRKHEFEADAYAAEIQETPEHLIMALKKLAADNLSNLTPHPLPVFLDYSHPPMLVRIKALRALDNTN